MPYLLKAEYESMFSAFLNKPVLAEAGLINLKTVQSMLSNHLDARADHGNRLWLILNAEVWYRMLIGGQSKESIAETLKEYS